MCTSLLTQKINIVHVKILTYPRLFHCNFEIL
jgi:RNA recognition motif-containing protein